MHIIYVQTEYHQQCVAV